MSLSRKRKLETNTTPKVNKIKKSRITLEHVASEAEKGEVLVTGAGDVGQLGLGPDVMEKTRAALVSLEQEIIDICAGGMHTVCLTKDGKVITFGCNDEGALGRVTDGKEDAEFNPAEVELPGKAIQISAGDSHTAALIEGGKVFAWGTFRDSHGNMGMTVDGNERLPYEIIRHVEVAKIASGADHMVFLTTHGDIYTCGCAEQGQLGRTSERSGSRNARHNSGNKGQLSKLLQPTAISVKLSLKLHFDDIWAGSYCTFAKVANKQDIYVFGLNNYYQIGLEKIGPEFFTQHSKDFSKYKWAEITCGQHHTIALTEDGKVYAIGRKDYGRLGLGEDCKDAELLTLVKQLADKKVVKVACGSSTSFAVTDKGELYAWGMGTNYQLGTGNDEDCFEPTLIKSKQLIDRKVIKVSSGGQHTVILAVATAVKNDEQ